VPGSDHCRLDVAGHLALPEVRRCKGGAQGGKERGMRVLIACECSGAVRRAFRARGHDAWSCDLQPADDGSQYHFQGDALGPIGYGWDLMIAHPPCTHLSVSGAGSFAAKRSDGRQQEAIDFFLALALAPIPRIAIENPVCIMSTVWRKPDQIIHPWQYGHGETKATCLWLKGLPHLVPTNIVPGREPRIHRMSPSADRGKLRSVTYQGIAEAMADQWGSAPLDLVTQMEAACATP
jgi:hypothetical protein